MSTGPAPTRARTCHCRGPGTLAGAQENLAQNARWRGRGPPSFSPDDRADVLPRNRPSGLSRPAGSHDPPTRGGAPPSRSCGGGGAARPNMAASSQVTCGVGRAWGCGARLPAGGGRAGGAPRSCRGACPPLPAAPPCAGEPRPGPPGPGPVRAWWREGAARPCQPRSASQRSHPVPPRVGSGQSSVRAYLLLSPVPLVFLTGARGP